MEKETENVCVGIILSIEQVCVEHCGRGLKSGLDMYGLDWNPNSLKVHDFRSFT